jgi:ectoine hydroxylase-related dioxygenase (phytanoyl-CoA dioxygenase family)
MSMIDVDDFRRSGYVLIPNVYDVDLLSQMRTNIDSDLDEWSSIMTIRGRTKESGIVAHHVLTKQHWVHFLDLLEPHKFFCQLLNSVPVVSAFGVLDNCKTSEIYVHHTHVDQRFLLSTPETIMLNILIFVDDFTTETGATLLCPGSHREIQSAAPDSEIQIIGSAGSVLVWDSRLRHRAGTNTMGKNRRAISLMLTRPWLKPQFDYSDFILQNSLDVSTDKVSQLLGLKCQVPRSLDDWYPLDGVRKYLPSQDEWIPD